MEWMSNLWDSITGNTVGDYQYNDMGLPLQEDTGSGVSTNDMLKVAGKFASAAKETFAGSGKQAASGSRSTFPSLGMRGTGIERTSMGTERPNEAGKARGIPGEDPQRIYQEWIQRLHAFSKRG